MHVSADVLQYLLLFAIAMAGYALGLRRGRKGG